jgi:redox-sensitive bicupin YhaK (pirin superfamily)
MQQQVIVQRAGSRGITRLSWLTSYHAFSFGGYIHPKWTGFGKLAVVNDDTIAGGMGFAPHPHKDMEIITIVLTGELRHEDSMGNHCILKRGDVQIMSAGTGIVHSEFNNDPRIPLTLLQIWIEPKELSVTPRHQERHFPYFEEKNIMYEVAAPTNTNNGFEIYQDAYMYIGTYEAQKVLSYKLHNERNGVFAFVIQGEALVDANRLEDRDSVHIEGLSGVPINFQKETTLLLIEVPLV